MALTCFVPDVKNTAGTLGGGANRFIYARRLLLEFHPPSKSGPESPSHREGGSGCKTKHCWGLGDAGSVSPSKSGPESPLCPS